MCIVHPNNFLGRLDGWDVEVDDYRFLSAANQHALERLTRAGVDLLMRHVRRNIDEVACVCLGGELEVLAPPHPSAALHNIDHALEIAVMMRSGLCVWVNADRASPELACARPRVSDRSRAVHPRRLRSVGVQIAGMNNPNAVAFPVRFRSVHTFGIALLEVLNVDQVSLPNASHARELLAVRRPLETEYLIGVEARKLFGCAAVYRLQPDV